MAGTAILVKLHLDLLIRLRLLRRFVLWVTPVLKALRLHVLQASIKIRLAKLHAIRVLLATNVHPQLFQNVASSTIVSLVKPFRRCATLESTRRKLLLPLYQIAQSVQLVTFAIVMDILALRARTQTFLLGAMHNAHLLASLNMTYVPKVCIVKVAPIVPCFQLTP